MKSKIIQKLFALIIMQLSFSYATHTNEGLIVYIYTNYQQIKINTEIKVKISKAYNYISHQDSKWFTAFIDIISNNIVISQSTNTRISDVNINENFLILENKGCCGQNTTFYYYNKYNGSLLFSRYNYFPLIEFHFSQSYFYFDSLINDKFIELKLYTFQGVICDNIIITNFGYNYDNERVHISLINFSNAINIYDISKENIPLIEKVEINVYNCNYTLTNKYLITQKGKIAKIGE